MTLPSWAAVTSRADAKAKRKTKGPGPEKVVQKAIQQAFKVKHQVVLIHIDAGAAGMRGQNAYGHSGIPAGFPDLMGVIPGGRALFIEVKAPGNKPTELQLRHLEAFRAKGAMAFWADSVESALQQFQEAA